jgi:hypothetical protein
MSSGSIEIRWTFFSSIEQTKKAITNVMTLSVGLAGFEPAHDGTKNRCLTAWL